MSSPRLIVGVLVAAGRGRRMGCTKQLLPWPPPGRDDLGETSSGNSTMVAAAFDAVRAICDRMIVVLDTEAGAVNEALGDRYYHQATGDGAAEMFASVHAGLHVANHLDPQADVLLHLADHPEVASGTLEAMIQQRQRYPDHVLVPTWRGSGGHPILIPPQVVIQALALATTYPGGLREFLDKNSDQVYRFECADRLVLQDFDTPEQFHKRS